MTAERDLVGELTDAVRKKNIRMGLYYSGGLDWTFYKVPINNVWPNLFMSIPQTPTYGSYVTAHYNELIEKYKPDLLWNDVNFPANGDFLGMLAYYYYKVPDGIINDRWNAKNKAIYGFQTPEYKVFEKKVDFKWETCRGLGNSFGYNTQETDQHCISPDNLIDLFVDVVSKNGNLLLNIGPDAQGTIPEIQLKRLQEMGAWLKINGESIYGTVPHSQAEGTSDVSTRIRYTRKGNDLYVLFLDQIRQEKIQLFDITCKSTCRITVLGKNDVKIGVQKGDKGTVLTFPKKWEDSYASVLKIEGYFGKK